MSRDPASDPKAVLAEHGRARVETCPKARAVEGGDQEAADSWQWHLKTLARSLAESAHHHHPQDYKHLQYHTFPIETITGITTSSALPP